MQNALGVAACDSAMLYVLLSPVGPYYKSGFKAVSLWTEERFSRAAPGGTGQDKVGGYVAHVACLRTRRWRPCLTHACARHARTPTHAHTHTHTCTRSRLSHEWGSNYAPTILPAELAMRRGYTQVLWLGPRQNITEVGTMNLFVYWINENGERELVTPPLDGTILPGVTRDSVLALAREWREFRVSEREVSIHELVKAAEEKRVLEIFGSGTAAIVSPVKNIGFRGADIPVPLDPADPRQEAGPLTRRVLNSIQDIQYGKTQFRDWVCAVD